MNQHTELNESNVPEYVLEHIKKVKNGPYPTLGVAFDEAKYNTKVSSWLQHYDDADNIINFEEAEENQEKFVKAWYAM